ncbi:MAG: SPOR domain-containing protein [Thermoanaerobaculia bacterium]
MESSETHEPSYYEVALTNRQVLIAFVVLLTSIVAAFLSGVWIGRGGSSPARQTPGITEAAAAPAEPPLEQLTFFNGKEPGARGAGTSAAAAGRPTAAISNRDTPASTDASTRAPGAAAPPNATTAEESAADATDATETMRQNLDATMAANRTVPAPAPATTAPAKPAGAPAKPAAAPFKEAAAGPTAAKPAVAGKIFVQVYSSTNATRAREIVAQLRKAGFAVVVAETAKGSGKNSRVRVGPYSERAKADAAAIRLRREFRLETWVTDSP